MTEEIEDEQNVFYLRDVIERLRRTQVPVISIIAITAILFLAFSFTLTKKYKASGVINVQTDYFRYPLIEEFLPSPVDLGEVSSRRDALVKAALSPEFVNTLGEKYALFSSKPDTVARKQETERLLDTFEVFSLSQTTVQISTFASKSTVAESLANEVIQRVVDFFSSERRDKILRARDSIRGRIEGMALTEDPTSAVMASKRPELLRAELNRLESEIYTLTQKFSSNHPTVVRLQKRANEIRSFLKQGTVQPKSPDVQLSKPLVGGEPEKATREVYEGLVKKLNYLNIALDMESDSKAALVRVIDVPVLPKSPIWPNRVMFVLWGCLTGTVIAAMTIVFLEFLSGGPIRARKLAKSLGTQFIGDFPIISTERSASKHSPKGSPEKNDRNFQST